ncbi:hypothetical protein EVAR_87861_1 [Eumeta japonica]|uniref:Uncharacterized protein n=1 Tax=Eumeta variegata TaxID=151549 RepID=A0A4C1WX89_EUMVA|nr:hypothetical protein EVAR_87861_1 [Eumeta japonica]
MLCYDVCCMTKHQERWLEAHLPVVLTFLTPWWMKMTLAYMLDVCQSSRINIQFVAEEQIRGSAVGCVLRCILLHVAGESLCYNVSPQKESGNKES